MSTFSKSLNAMGGYFTYKILLKNGVDQKNAALLITEAHESVLEVERLFNEFDEKSLISEVNRMAGIKSVTIPMQHMTLFEEAIRFGRFTKGYFDITFRSSNRKRSYNKIQLTDNSVFLPCNDMKISVGGIGKGYAVDLAYNKLLNSGVKNFIVNGNGDIRVHSAQDALRSWKIAIRNPFSYRDKSIGFMPIRSGSVASSGNYINTGHIVCDKDNIQGVTVKAKLAMEADVLGTSLMSMGLAKAIKFCDKNNIEAIIVDVTGKVHHTLNQGQVNVLQDTNHSFHI